MKNQAVSLRKVMTIMVLIFSLTAASCKKDKIEEDKLPSIVGTWSNVTQIGSFRNIVTEILFKPDGNGNEVIMNITTGSSNVTSDLNFKWTSENNNTVNLQFADGQVEKYTYTFNTNEDGDRLILTSESGNSKDYFKMD